MHAHQGAFRREFSAPTRTDALTAMSPIAPIVARLRANLLRQQLVVGCWCRPVASDLGTEADVLLLLDFVGRHHDPRRGPLARALLAQQRPDGGWGDDANGLNATVHAYLALSGGDLDPEAEPLQRARGWLKSQRAARIDDPTRLRLALFGQVPHDGDWAALPASSTAETLAFRIIDTLKPVKLRPRDPVLAHLLRDEIRPPVGPSWNPLRRWNVRRTAQQLSRLLIDIDRSDADGVTSVMPLIALHAAGIGRDAPAPAAAWSNLDERIEVENGMARVAPEVSPLRDTATALLALHAAGTNAPGDWLWDRLVRGHARGDLPPLDAALALLALARTGHALRGERPALVEHMLNELLARQDDAGGWESCELTGLMLDVLGALGVNGREPAVVDAIDYLETVQEPDSGWAGDDPWRATWRVLSGLRSVGHDSRSLMVRRAAAWLKRTQHVGGGWGEAPDASTSFGVLALVAAGEAFSPEVDAGANRLLTMEADDMFALLALAPLAA